MHHQELLDYIDKARLKGMTPEEVVNRLVDAGYSREAIAEHIAAVKEKHRGEGTFLFLIHRFLGK